MGLLNHRVLGMALLSATLAVSGLKAYGAKGTFTLPFDAQWNNIELKAGNYTLETPVSTSWPQVISLTGNGKTVYILAGNETVAADSSESYLKIAEVNGVRFIEEYKSGARGKSFTFAVPKALRAEMAAGKTKATEIAVMIRH